MGGAGHPDNFNSGADKAESTLDRLSLPVYNTRRHAEKHLKKKVGTVNNQQLVHIFITSLISDAVKILK